MNGLIDEWMTQGKWTGVINVQKLNAIAFHTEYLTVKCWQWQNLSWEIRSTRRQADSCNCSKGVTRHWIFLHFWGFIVYVVWCLVLFGALQRSQKAHFEWGKCHWWLAWEERRADYSMDIPLLTGSKVLIIKQLNERLTYELTADPLQINCVFLWVWNIYPAHLAGPHLKIHCVYFHAWLRFSLQTSDLMEML